MSIQHELITDPKIHEPKGASTASANTVYVANGSGSGSWSALTTSSLPMGDIETDINSKIADGTIDLPIHGFIYCEFTDVSTADSIIIPIIRSCTIVGARFTLAAAINTADSIVQVKAASGSAMGSDVTIAQSGSAKGTSFSFTANSNNVLTGPTWMEITTDGASSGVAKLGVLIEYTYVAN